MLRRRREFWLTLGLLIPGGLQFAANRSVGSSGHAERPILLFVIVAIAATACALFAGLLIRRGLRSGIAELAWTGLFFFAASVLPLVHGLTTPGALYGENVATMAAVFWAIPVAVVSASPVLMNRTSTIARSWRRWTKAALSGQVLLGAVMLIDPQLVPFPRPASAAGLSITGLSLLGTALLARRQVRLSRFAGSPRPLVVAAGYSLVAGSAVGLYGASAYSTAFWLAHGLDIAGVFAGGIGGLIAYRRNRSMQEVLQPVLMVEPIAALEVGLHPSIVQFVEELDQKDPLTRDHVVRTSELAIAVGQALGLSPLELRRVGLVGLLHDIGKLYIPTAILTKDGPLSPDEWTTIRGHSDLGADLLAESEALADLSAGVRSHHEKFDGTGYPRGLAGEQIPIEARVIAVCDAFDAMANTRSYREGMSVDTALAVLEENEANQWDPTIVQVAVQAISTHGVRPPQLLGGIRRIGCDCLPELAHA